MRVRQKVIAQFKNNERSDCLMPKEKNEKLLSVDDLRHAEYYNMQETFDNLYAQSKDGQVFTQLIDKILSRENILLAYRNIKTNNGSKTCGTDRLTIKDIGCLSPHEVVEKVRFIVKGTRHGYRPKPVRRKDIPKPNGSTRPLGIPCIWDRLVQQCIKQIIEPICEAKFSDNSYGFRPQRCVEHAIQATYRLAQRSKLHYVIEFDIKSFFDNVNHTKLIKQIWALGIRDKHLIWIIKQILKAPIKMPDGKLIYPDKGTPQGGIISPLLANIVLNELDQWIDSQWQNNPVVNKYKTPLNKNGSIIRSDGYKAMRKTNLKEMHIVRYADDFRIFCRTRTEAQKIKIAITQWLFERLSLEISTEKTRIVNIKNRYSEFLGFKIKLQKKGDEYVVKSHMCDKQLRNQKEKLVAQAKQIANPTDKRDTTEEIRLYNSMVLGIHNYYRIATNISIDCKSMSFAVMRVLTNRLGVKGRNARLRRKGRKLTPVEMKLYGASQMLRYEVETNEPIYPIGYVRHKKPLAKKRSICCYTTDGRKDIHTDLRINKALLHKMMEQPTQHWSAEFADNRISLFCAQWGKCAVTGRAFLTLEDIHCHHINRKANGGEDKYDNLRLVLEPVHRLIHASNNETIMVYLKLLNLDKIQIDKLNNLREKLGLAKVVCT